MSKPKITYQQVGDDYSTKDPIKKLAQTAASQTAKHLEALKYKEISDSRGESAFVWQVDEETFMASVIEGLGTKNLIADGMRNITGKTYYDIIAHDTVASIINDLASSGAKPFVLHAYWAIEDNSWLQDQERMKDLIQGWKDACDLSGVAWGGGETPTLKGIIKEGTVDLAGSAIGIIKNDKRRIRAQNLVAGDRIIFVKSNGINANGVSLARAISKKLPHGYATKLPSGKMYGEALLTKTNIYAKLIQDLLDDVDVHYISNITGHGLRKVMRAPYDFVYKVEKVYPVPEVFSFIQQHANLTDSEEMYGTYNMGQDYAIFLPVEDVTKAQEIIIKNGFESLDAGYLEKGARKVIIQPKKITFEGETLDLR